MTHGVYVTAGVMVGVCDHVSASTGGAILIGYDRIADILVSEDDSEASSLLSRPSLRDRASVVALASTQCVRPGGVLKNINRYLNKTFFHASAILATRAHTMVCWSLPVVARRFSENIREPT